MWTLLFKFIVGCGKMPDYQLFAKWWLCAIFVWGLVLFPLGLIVLSNLKISPKVAKAVLIFFIIGTIVLSSPIIIGLVQALL